MAGTGDRRLNTGHPLPLDDSRRLMGGNLFFSGTGAVLVLQGGFPRRCTRNEDLQAVERTRYAGLAFAQIWRELGGHVHAGSRGWG